MHTSDMPRIMQILRQRRQTLGYSYQDLADLTGMSKSTLQRYETGGIHSIPLHKVKILARALQTEPERLMGWEDTGPSDALEAEEALRLYFSRKAGRPPTETELRRLDEFAAVFIRGLGK